MNLIKQLFNKNIKNFKLDILSNTENKSNIPDRYRIKKSPQGDLLTCVEAPNIAVKIQRGFVVSLNEAKKFPERSIFIDGAARGEPFLDNARQIYNLDHHEGCERTFTLATCEQAIILVRKGLNLKEKNWTIYANEPDLDTILAIWIFLNHIYLSTGDSKVYKKMIPIIRLEGIIDALGLELIDICAFPPNLLKEIKTKIENLRKIELKLKQDGLWNTINYVKYTHKILNMLDTIALEREDIKNLKSIVELARAEISDEDSVVVFEGDLGIYELEEYLNKIYNKKPTVVILKKNKNNYTIRKGDIFRPLNLDSIYERLNIFDKNVNGRLKENRWGGSNQIGGSPRITGTSLNPNQIVEICKNAFYVPGNREKLNLFLKTIWIGNLPNIISWSIIILVLMNPTYHYFLTIPMSLKVDIYYYIYLLFLTYFSFFYIAHIPHVFGFRFPTGYKWIRWIILAIIFSFLGGLWIPQEFFNAQSVYNFIVSFVIGPILTSIFYFSFLHGMLIFYFPIQRYEGKFFISIPCLYISISYAISSILLPFYQYSFNTIFHDFHNLMITLFRLPIIFLYSLSLIFLRERSESIYPVIITHTLIHILYVFIKLF